MPDPSHDKVSLAVYPYLEYLFVLLFLLFVVIILYLLICVTIKKCLNYTNLSCVKPIVC